ncbi:hypothetical protein AB6A40_008959 [Gnathostoma spinigerum]|uniref:Dynein light chain n=1 Tax=Gnathostoma spinigerum TaxID=75299 RepID=A0ABD6EQJ8_9BILA
MGDNEGVEIILSPSPDIPFNRISEEDGRNANPEDTAVSREDVAVLPDHSGDRAPQDYPTPQPDPPYPLDNPSEPSDPFVIQPGHYLPDDTDKGAFVEGDIPGIPATRKEFQPSIPRPSEPISHPDQPVQPVYPRSSDRDAHPHPVQLPDQPQPNPHQFQPVHPQPRQQQPIPYQPPPQIPSQRPQVSPSNQRIEQAPYPAPQPQPTPYQQPHPLGGNFPPPTQSTHPKDPRFTGTQRQPEPRGMDAPQPEYYPGGEGGYAPSSGEQPYPEPHPQIHQTDPNVKILASGMRPDVQEYAVALARQAIAEFPHEKMRIAHHLMTKFEESYGPPWCCVVSDGQLGFYVRYDPVNHIYFAVGEIILFLFKTQ